MIKPELFHQHTLMCGLEILRYRVVDNDKSIQQCRRKQEFAKSGLILQFVFGKEQPLQLCSTNKSNVSCLRLNLITRMNDAQTGTPC